MVNKPRSKEPAKPYKELITSPVYFSNEKWQECLSSHGILVDKEEKTLTIQSEQVHADMVYDITDAELSALASNSIEKHPVEKRLEILDNVIQNEYSDKVTLESLNSKERISIALHPEVEQDLAMRNQQEQDLLLPLESDNSLTPNSAEHIIREPHTRYGNVCTKPVRQP